MRVSTRGKRSLTSDGGLVVVRVGVVGVEHLDTLSLQLLHFAFKVPFGPQEVLDLLFFGLPKNLVVVLSDLLFPATGDTWRLRRVLRFTLNCRLTLSLSCSKVAARSMAWYLASSALSFSLRIFW